MSGESFLEVLDALPAAGVRVIATRHEGGASFMAEAVGQLTGEPAAVLGFIGYSIRFGGEADHARPIVGPQPADHFPGQFALVKRSDGTEQITYDGMPLYTLKGAKPLLTTGNGQGGVWHVIKLSASNIG